VTLVVTHALNISATSLLELKQASLFVNGAVNNAGELRLTSSKLTLASGAPVHSTGRITLSSGSEILANDTAKPMVTLGPTAVLDCSSGLCSLGGSSANRELRLAALPGSTITASTSTSDLSLSTR
jgi:hypothetical protein